MKQLLLGALLCVGAFCTTSAMVEHIQSEDLFKCPICLDPCGETDTAVELPCHQRFAHIDCIISLQSNYPEERCALCHLVESLRVKPGFQTHEIKSQENQPELSSSRMNTNDESRRSEAVPTSAQEENPLITAVKSNAIETVRDLLKQNANPFAEDSSGKTALDYARANSEMLQVFAENWQIDVRELQ